MVVYVRHLEQRLTDTKVLKNTIIFVTSFYGSRDRRPGPITHVQLFLH